MDALLAHSPGAVPCSWPSSRHRSPLAAALQIPFPAMLLAFRGSCISNGKMSPSSVRPAIPQSALQLTESALSRGGGGSRANKNNFPVSARAESGSAVSRDLQRGLASARRVLLPGGLGISVRYQLPGGRGSVRLASHGDCPQHAAA